MPANPTPAERQNGIRNTVIVIVLVITLMLGLFVNKILHPRILSPKEMVANGAVIFSVPREISPLVLADQNGAEFTEESFRNKWTFVFFGFTHCPDICPTTLALFNQLSERLASTELATDTQFLFVSLDPARDTVEKIKPYIEYFNPDFVGLTGDFLTIHRLSKQLNVAFRKVTTNSETGDYTIDHGGNIALINPNGHYSGFYKPPLDVNKIELTYQSLRLENR